MQRLHEEIAKTRRIQEEKFQQQREQYKIQMIKLSSDKDATNERVRAALGMKGASTQIVRGRHVTGNESAGEVQLVVSQWTK